MIAKFVALLCFLGLARASGWHGLGYASDYSSGLGYASGYGLGYSGIVAPAYTTVTKAIVPSVAYAPAVSSVSRYQVHSSPIVKSYVVPVAYTAPAVSYSHGYSGLGYSGHGGYSGLGGYSTGYGYGTGYGYSKGLW